MRKKLLGAILLAGCQPLHEDCRTGPLHWDSSAGTAHPARCSDFGREYELARSMLVERGLIPTAKDVDSTVNDYFVVTKSENSWMLMGSSVCGQYDYVSATITLGRDRTALLHEILHGWQAVHLNFTTINHDGWCTNGYDGADMAYESAILWYHASGWDSPWPGMIVTHVDACTIEAQPVVQ